MLNVPDSFSVLRVPAYGFAALVSHNENLNSPKQDSLGAEINRPGIPSLSP